MTEKNFTLGDNVEHFTIADVARDNPDFRKVLWTGERAQIVVMTIPPGGEIGGRGPRTHRPDPDLCLRYRRGGPQRSHPPPIEAGDQCAVPAGAQHNFRNTGEESLGSLTRFRGHSWLVDHAAAVAAV